MQAQTASPQLMPLGAVTMAPRGFLAFCARYPKECGLDAANADPQEAERILMSQQWEMVFAGASQAPKPSPPVAAPSEQAAEGPAPFTITADLTPRRSEGRALPMKAIYQPTSRPIILSSFFYEIEPPSDFAVFGSHRWSSAADFRAWRSEQFTVSTPARVGASSPIAESRDAARLQQIREVNDRINAAITPATDVQAFGVNDVWTLPLKRGGRALGNCKHYVLEKRRALADAGVPSADMSIAIVRTLAGQMHAVLLVNTIQGEVVLDNLTSDIRNWRDVNYTWLERQKPGEPLVWVALDILSNPPPRG